MTRRLYLIAIPIIISIFGTIWFQIDWIGKTYTNESKKMNSLADTALRRAVVEIDREQQDSVARLLKPTLRILRDSVGLTFSTNGDSLMLKLNNTLAFEDGDYSVERQVYNVGRVGINWPMYNVFSKKMIKELGYLTTNGDRIITDRLDEIMLLYMKTSDSLYYKSDSIKIDNYMRKHLLSFGIDNPTKLYFFKGANKQMEITLANNSIIKEYKPQGMNRYTGEKRWVGVYLPDQDRYILSKMLLGSIVSVFLIHIMIGSFIFLIRTILKQKRLAEMKDDFIDNLTHEFKTPIATIAVAIEGIQNFNALNDIDKTNRYLAISKNELNRLNQMVSNILNVASHEKRNIELSTSEINLTEMVQEVIGLEHFRAAKEVNFVFSIAEETNYLKVDPLHFKNVLINLVDNAVKYANDSVEITLTAIKQNNNLEFVIKDNGIGIPTSQLKYVFDKFYRVPTGNIYNVKGIGLGLSYVKSIVTAHKGIITVKSEINLGTTFTILIPLS